MWFRPTPIKTGRILAGLGIQPQSTAAVLPSYLWHYRTAGQFTRKSESVELRASV